MPATTTVAARTDDARSAARASRFHARYWLWKHSTMGRVAACGRYLVDGASVVVRVTGAGSEARAGLSGVQTCGSTWACPCCAARIAAGRRVEVETAVAAWLEDGGTVAHLTFTVRHQEWMPLEQTWEAVAGAWRRIVQGRAHQLEKRTWGVRLPGAPRSSIGYCRVVETTHGANGWHTHVHVLVFLGGHAGQDALDHLAGAWFARWACGLPPGYEPEQRRCSARLVESAEAGAMGDYFVKSTWDGARSAGFEMVGSQTKAGRGGSRTPWELLADAIEGDPDAARLWAEWEAGSKGRRQLTWAKGWREYLLAGAADVTDDDLAEDGALGGDVVAVLDPVTWGRVAGARRVHRLLDAAEAGSRALAEFLDLLDVGWRPPDQRLSA